MIHWHQKKYDKFTYLSAPLHNNPLMNLQVGRKTKVIVYKLFLSHTSTHSLNLNKKIL